MRHDRIAAARAAPTATRLVECPGCEGEGEVEILALDAVRPSVEDCSQCDGTGKITITIRRVNNG